MKISEAKKLIGKRIMWRTKRNLSWRSGQFVSTHGKNILTGCGEYLWGPDVIEVKEVEESRCNE